MPASNRSSTCGSPSLSSSLSFTAWVKVRKLRHLCCLGKGIYRFFVYHGGAQNPCCFICACLNWLETEPGAGSRIIASSLKNPRQLMNLFLVKWMVPTGICNLSIIQFSHICGCNPLDFTWNPIMALSNRACIFQNQILVPDGPQSWPMYSRGATNVPWLRVRNMWAAHHTSPCRTRSLLWPYSVGILCW